MHTAPGPRAAHAQPVSKTSSLSRDSTGIDKDDVAVLINTLDADHNGLISRKEFRDGLARIRESKVRKGTAKNVAMLSSLMLDAFIAPVKPPKTESFQDLMPFGKFRYEPASIPDTHYRSLKLEQIRKIYAHVDRRCEKEGWCSSSSEGTAGSTNFRVMPHEVTHYDLSAYVIKPATGYHRCRYAAKTTTALQASPFLALTQPPPYLSSWF